MEIPESQINIIVGFTYSEDSFSETSTLTISF